MKRKTMMMVCAVCAMSLVAVGGDRRDKGDPAPPQVYIQQCWRLQWATEPGVRYALEGSLDMAGWQVEAYIDGDGGPAQVYRSYDKGDVLAKYYRVRVVE